jgi:hypothetical protein
VLGAALWIAWGLALLAALVRAGLEERWPAAMAAFQPLTPEAAPIVLQAQARRLPGWTMDGRMAGRLPASPAAGEGPVDDVALIPMGCARLRVSVFPVVRD